MKSFSYLALVIGLTACGTAAKPDARLAVIQAQHQQIVAAQHEAVAQEKNAELVRLGRAAESQKRFAELLQESQANLASIAQLDPAQSQDPGQVALVGTAATKEAELLKEAQATVTYNRYLLTAAEKRSRTLDSLKQVINGVKK